MTAGLFKPGQYERCAWLLCVRAVYSRTVIGAALYVKSTACP